jgi:hypothetical protein
MCQQCEKTIDDMWRKLQVGQTFKTPDLYRGIDFQISKKDTDQLEISPQNISINKSAFLATVHYLRINDHDMDSPCEIRSSNNRSTAGPLCIAARDQNSNIRCINYILPILQKNVVVGINPVRPNSTWLLRW